MAGISLKHIAAALSKVGLRFPVTTVCSGILTLLLIVLLTTDLLQPNQIVLYKRLATATYLCMLLSIAVQLYCERLRLKTTHRLSMYMIAILLCCIWFFQSYKQPAVPYMWSSAIICCCLHLLVAVAPFSPDQSNSVFWQFNRFIFLRILLSFLYSSVLFLGIAVALFGIDHLLGIRIDADLYTVFWCVIGVFFTTTFFLSGLPSIEVIEHKSDEVFPSGLKVFTANVLLPLVLVYLLILYFYTLRLVTGGNWLAPWLAYFVSIAAIFGILSLLLLHPLIEKNRQSILTKAFVGFFYALLPLVLLLIVSVGKQVWLYGMSESRYIRLVIGVWLLWLSFRFIKNSSAGLRNIPLSLLLLGLLSVFGPWSMHSLTLFSQKKHLRTMFIAQGLCNEQGVPLQGKTITVPHEYKLALQEQLLFLVKRTQVMNLQDLFEKPFKDFTGSDWEKSEYLLSLLPIIEEPKKESAAPGNIGKDEEAIETRIFERTNKEALAIAPYQYQINVDFDNSSTDVFEFSIKSKRYNLSYLAKQSSFLLRTNSDSIQIPCAALFDSLWYAPQKPKNLSYYSKSAQTAKLSAKLVINSIELNRVIELSPDKMHAVLLLSEYK